MSQLRISDELFAAAKSEADQMHRKVGGQVEHWATLGRLLERSVSYQHVKAFLAGTLAIDQLSSLEHAIVLQSITDEVAAFSREGRIKEHLARQDAIGAGSRAR
jgi:hypothetical protein